MDQGQPLIDKQPNQAAQLLRKMAEHVERNAGATFGGVAVVIPPANGGDPVELLILDSAADPATFYATIKSRLETEVLKLDAASRQQQAFRR